MRIRRNRKIAALISPGVPIKPYDCLTNQSPLDIISNSPNPDSAFDSCLLKFGRNSRFERDANTNVISVEREVPKAAGKKVDGGDGSEKIVTADKDETRTEKGKTVRPRSQRSAAKNPRWLNSKSKDFYYYDCD